MADRRLSADDERAGHCGADFHKAAAVSWSAT
jgi:hypothetical protein